MMRKLRALLFVVLSFFLVTSWTTSIFAEAKATESAAAKQYKVYVMDKADLLTPEEEKKLATEMTEKLGADGFNLVQNNNTCAGQTVFHFHMHLIPRYENDGAAVAAWMPNAFSDEVMAEIRESMRF